MIQKLPSYLSDEVRVFHPICNQALKKALNELGLSSQYEVKHHMSINGIIPDFVIINKQSGKILLIVEVKRTPAQVMSTRYKNQAQSYLLEAETRNIEKPYYLLTNLEISNFFKYNKNKTSVNSQLLSPSPVISGTFKDDYASFFEKLVTSFKFFIETSHNDSGDYIISYEEIMKELKHYSKSEKEWHSAVSVLGYEFIRNVLNEQGRQEVTNWGPAIQYAKNPQMIQRLLSQIDFKSLTRGEIDKSNKDIWIPRLLDQAAKLGSSAWDGDEFASLAHELLISGIEHEGVVPTDLDLAAVLASLTFQETDISDNGVICDPAAGSGNLLSAAITRYSSIQPYQLWANDIMSKTQDILTLRFGLKFPHTVSPVNFPKITCQDVLDLNLNDFSNVEVILLNPPYLSGIETRTLDLKTKFYDKIIELTGKEPITRGGQMNLEGLFLELVLSLGQEGTKIGIVFPEAHLFSKGIEAVSIRKLLLEKFGLTKIFSYPREGLFKDVTKGTIILIGEIGKRVDTVKVVNSFLTLEEIELDLIEDNYGSALQEVTYEALVQTYKTSWKSILFPELEQLILEMKIELNELDSKKVKRGGAGNLGITDLLFPNKLHFWNEISNIIPSDWFQLAVENVKDIKHGSLINEETVSNRILCPPDSAFLDGTADNILLNYFLDVVKENLKEKSSTSKQKKNEKNREETLKIIQKDSRRITSAGSILVPRNLRNTFKLFILEEPAVIGTNFFIIESDSEKEMKQTVSWLMSIFGQIQLEFFSKPQEGARKMEKNELMLMKFPKKIFERNTYCDKGIELNRDFHDYFNTDENDLFWLEKLEFNEFTLRRFQNIFYDMVNLRNP